MSGKSFTEAAHAVGKGMDPKDLIQDLAPQVQMKAQCLIYLLAYAGYGLAHTTGGKRSYDFQCELYGQGRTEDQCRKMGILARYAKPEKKVVTWCAPDQSDHVRGTAIDVDLTPYVPGELTQIDEIAKALNICWGGLWRVRDYCHFSLAKKYGEGR